MLTNGFFARMIVLECGTRSAGREPCLLPLPERVLETARWWADFRAGTGDLQNWHAVSENHEQPEIGKAATEWASRLVLHEARRMLYVAQSHVADNPFQGECLKLLRKLRAAPGGELSHSALLKRMKMDAESFMLVVGTFDLKDQPERAKEAAYHLRAELLTWRADG